MKATKMMVVAIVAVGLVLGLGGVASAAVTQWTNTDPLGGAWDTPSNWDNGVPVPGSTAWLPIGAPPGTALITNEAAVCGALLVGKFTGTSATVKQSGGTLTIDSGIIGDYGSGTFVQSGGSVSITNGLIVGIRVASMYRMMGSTGSTTIGGTLDFNASGKLELQPTAASIRPFVAGGNVTLTPGATLDVDFLVGDPCETTVFTVIDNNSGNAIGGQFTYAHGGLLGEGDPFTVPGVGGNVELQIPYAGGTSGKDLTLTVLDSPAGAPVPEPAGLGLIGLALLAIRRKRS